VISERFNADCPTVAVILVNWNGWRDTVECIDSLLTQRYPAFHIFVVDNDSQDGSVEQILAWCGNPVPAQGWRQHEGVDRWTDSRPVEPIACRIADNPVTTRLQTTPACRVTVIRSGGNLGFAGGCNVAIRAAITEDFSFFWLLNTDTVVHREALYELVQRALRDQTIGMVGSTIRYYDRPEVVQSLGGGGLEFGTVTSRLIGTGCDVATIPQDGTAVERDMVYVMGASMLVSSQFVRDIGLLQEDYFLYYEEIDWALRARGRFKLGYAPASCVFHKSGASSFKVMPLFTARLYYRNRIRFVTRFFPERLNAAKRGLAVELVRHVLRGRWGNARVVGSVLWTANNTAAQIRSGQR
jgi:GT2 family glycosyltransferase